jgi:hypothetical protein
MVKTECFAYDCVKLANGRTTEVCRALTSMICKNGECSFYKTPEQACHECTYMDCKGCINVACREK